MTLDKHKLDGIPQITTKTLPTSDFEGMLNYCRGEWPFAPTIVRRSLLLIIPRQNQTH